MVRIVRSVIGIALLVWTPTLSAQYNRSLTDTTRVREVTVGAVSVTTPGGIVNLRSEHDAVIAIAFGRADSAQAWYESLRVSSSSPQGRQEPQTAAALRQPFALRFDERGRIETLRTPTFPASFEGVTDLSHQFDDLFLRLPATPLTLGFAWTDTAVIASSGPDRQSSRSEREISSRVVRDTIIAGESAWVVETSQKHSLTSSQPVRGQPLIVRTRLTGADSGIFVFSKSNGRLLARQRSGTLSGSLTYEGGPQPVVLPVRQRYESSVTRVP